MRVAVVGGTGMVGSRVVKVLRDRQQDVVVVSRSQGIDLVKNEGIDEALVDVDVVIDVTSVEATDVVATRNLFGAMTKNLVAAEQHAGVKHHVLLSILGLDLIEGNAHYAGKRVQEDFVSGSPIPFSILRAAQFYEFAEMVVNWVKDDEGAVLPPILIQPVAVSDVVDVLVEIALGEPQGHIDLAGPEPQDFIDMTRRVLAARGESIKLIPSWQGLFGVEAAGEIMLPDSDARLAPTTFDEWLARL
jgi:uncharacterized protein YbjT (DUF2867 family)